MEPTTVQSLAEGDNARTVTLHVGESVRIVLPENATTGYRWAVDRQATGLVDAVPVEYRPTSTALGAGGEVEFTFRALRAGEGELALKHWRSWEGDASVIARFGVRLRVQP